MLDNRVLNIINKKDKPTTIFFCGIGGIGMSGLALLANSCGYFVIGSDIEENKNTLMLKDKGIKVFIGHNGKNINDVDILVYSSAINLNTNCEIIEANNKHIPIIQRTQMLAILMKHYFNIVVAGSHGKTTTTALIGHMLECRKLKPNIIIGGILNNCHSNCQIEGGKYFVIESDESDGSFEQLCPDIGVITNIDPEHMEFYKTEERLENYFLSFAKKSIEKSGVIVCIDDKIGRDLIHKLKSEKYDETKILTYSIFDKKADLYADNIKYKENGINFDFYDNRNNLLIKDIFLSNMFGRHNVSNTLASFGVGKLLKQDLIQISQTFNNFVGIQKRFTILGKINNFLVVDDYAHNPQKITACIESAKHYAKCNNLKQGITIVFEPHRYTRVRDSMKLFVEAMKEVDNIIIMPIYASSEEPIDGITDEYVFNELKKKNNNVYMTTTNEEDVYNKIIEVEKKHGTDIVVFMGAGKSSKIAHQVIEIGNKNK